MRVTFYSNYLNHHQIPFCNAIINLVGKDNFTFVATEKMDDERINMGWNFNENYKFELKSWLNKENYNRAINLAKISDLIIAGGSDSQEPFVNYRMKYSKLTFRYSERILKRGLWRCYDPRSLMKRYKTYFQYRNKPLYMLCASGYAASDFAMQGSYINRCYKWGYFPENRRYDLTELFSKKDNLVTEILWVSRIIDWKHPEKVVKVAKCLKNKGYKFHITMIGTGNLEEIIKKEIDKYKINDLITIRGNMKPEQVRNHMEKANIFLLTSDYNEGWGAVLNESMNSGCALVVSHAVGAVPFLVSHGLNGFVYKDDCFDDLLEKIIELIDNKKLQRMLGEEAYKTITYTWNAEIAAVNLLKVSEGGILNKDLIPKYGPCSIAEVIPQKKMYKLLINRS